MKRQPLRMAALAVAAMLPGQFPAQAGTYLACALAPDAEHRSLPFCPGGAGAKEGEPCQCLIRTGPISGVMTLLHIPDTATAAPPVMCASDADHAGVRLLCSSYRSLGAVACECDTAQGPIRGEQYTPSLLPRIPFRTNQTAAADFLRRLQECCAAK
jgi:hypothetical protein